MVDLTIRLNPANCNQAFQPYELAYWLPALKAAATEIQALNQALAQILPTPLPCNPDAAQAEGFLGDVNTIPSEYGYVSIRLINFRRLVIPVGVSPSTFSFVLGPPIEDAPDGSEIYASGVIT